MWTTSTLQRAGGESEVLVLEQAIGTVTISSRSDSISLKYQWTIHTGRAIIACPCFIYLLPSCVSKLFPKHLQEEWYRFEGEAGTQLADERSRPGWEVKSSDQDFFSNFLILLGVSRHSVLLRDLLLGRITGVRHQ